jgi:hypothetical protein
MTPLEHEDLTTTEQVVDETAAIDAAESAIGGGRGGIHRWASREWR